MTPLLLLYTGLCASVSAVSFLSILILPPGIIACIVLLLSGLYISVTAVDKLLLTHGVRDYIPPWLHTALAERDLFELWVDFLRENNPIMIFLRLTALKVFDLNREEAVVLMGGVATPWMRKLRRRTFISLLPESVKTRYAPDLRLPPIIHPSITNLLSENSPNLPSHQLIHRESSLESLSPLSADASKRTSLSAVLLQILEARLRPKLANTGPKIRKIVMRVALGFLLYTLISRTKRWKNLRAKINLSAIFWLGVLGCSAVLPVDFPAWILPSSEKKKRPAGAVSRLVDVLKTKVGRKDSSNSPISSTSSHQDETTTPRFSSTSPGSSCPPSPARLHWELDMCYLNREF